MPVKPPEDWKPNDDISPRKSWWAPDGYGGPEIVADPRSPKPEDSFWHGTVVVSDDDRQAMVEKFGAAKSNQEAGDEPITKESLNRLDGFSSGVEEGDDWTCAECGGGGEISGQFHPECESDRRRKLTEELNDDQDA